MENFTYCNPVQIEFGKDKEKDIGKHLHVNKIKKVLLVYGSQRIKTNGLFDTVTKSLEEYGISYVECSGVISNPILSKVNEGIKIAQENQVEAILAVGGGSVLDSSKSIATGTLYEGDVWDFFIGKEKITRALPVFDIMTLAATGSEMNCFAVVTNTQTKQKYSIKHPVLYPKVSIINPELQKSVSKEYLVYSAADIIAHCIEGYFTANVQPNLINRQVEAIIQTVIETTEILLKNPQDYAARAEFAWAATNALNGTTTLGTAGFSFPNHMIEHSLSALFNVPHGAGLSVLMPAWMKWYYKTNEKQFQRFAKVIFAKSSSKEGIEALESWFNKICTPTKLGELNITETDIEAIVENASHSAKDYGLSHIYTKEALSTILHNAL
jgi:NADP-dependent alcohol dehydrogenase